MPKYFTYFPPSSFLWIRHLTYFLLSFRRQQAAFSTLYKKGGHFVTLLTLFIVQWTLLQEQAHAQSVQWSQYTETNSIQTLAASEQERVNMAGSLNTGSNRNRSTRPPEMNTKRPAKGLLAGTVPADDKLKQKVNKTLDKV